MTDIFAKSRIEYLEEMLLACGWSRSPNFADDAWIAPDFMRDILAVSWGRGCYRLSDAVTAQITADQARLAMAAAS